MIENKNCSQIRYPNHPKELSKESTRIRAKYIPLLEFSVRDLSLHEFLSHLKKFCIKNNKPIPSILNDSLPPKATETSCASVINFIIRICDSVDNLDTITRYMFNRFALRPLALRAKGTFSFPYSQDFLDNLQDWRRIAEFVQSVRVAMQSNDDSSHIKANVIFTQRDDLRIFTIDRVDVNQPSAAVEVSIIYMIKRIPFIFISPFNTPVDVLCRVLQTTSTIHLPDEIESESMTLSKVIVKNAFTAGLGHQQFSESLRDLLQLNTRTLRRMEREVLLRKYLSRYCCPFDTVKVKVVEGFDLVVKSNVMSVIERFYEMERMGGVCVGENVSQDLVSGVGNEFTTDEFFRKR